LAEKFRLGEVLIIGSVRIFTKEFLQRAQGRAGDDSLTSDGIFMDPNTRLDWPIADLRFSMLEMSIGF
jgi:hypothetical protein